MGAYPCTCDHCAIVTSHPHPQLIYIVPSCFIHVVLYGIVLRCCYRSIDTCCGALALQPAIDSPWIRSGISGRSGIWDKIWDLRPVRVLHQAQDIQNTMDHMISTFESAVRAMPPGVEQWVWVCDFAGAPTTAISCVFVSPCGCTSWCISFSGLCHVLISYQVFVHVLRLCRFLTAEGALRECACCHSYFERHWHDELAQRNRVTL